MMNVVTLWMLCSTLLASLVWSPSPSLQHLRKDADADDGNVDVVVRQGHTIIVYEFRQEHHQDVKDFGGWAGVDSVRQAANHLTDSVASLLEHAGKGEQQANDKAGETGSSAADNAGEAMRGAKDTTEETMDCAQSKTLETMRAAKDKAEESLQGAMNAAKDNTQETMHSAKDKAVETVHSAKDKVQESLHSSTDMVQGAMHSAKDKTDETMRAVKGKAEESLYSAKGKAVEAASSAKGKMEEAMQAARSKAMDLLGLEHRTQVCDTEPACRDEAGMHGSSQDRAARERVSAIAAEWLRSCKKMKRQGQEQKRLWVQVPSLRAVARAVHVLAVATAHGAAVWVTLAQGQVVAKALQRQAFAVVQRRLYVLYFRALACTLGIALASLCALQPPLRCLPPLLLSLLSAFLNMFYLEPAATKVIMERLRLEKEEGRGMEENAAAADSSSLDEEVKKKMSVVTKRGTVIHGYSWLCNLVSMTALTWHLVYLSCNMHL